MVFFKRYLCFFMLLHCATCVLAVGTARAARVVHNSTIPEASVHIGLIGAGTTAVLTSFMAQRLQPSSKSTITTARTKWWVPYRCQHGLEEFIPSGHPGRGGEMASFVLHLANHSLAYSTITGYVWAVVDLHTSSGYASPLSNVRDWAIFMHSVEVEVHRPSEPRRMLPWYLFVRSIPLVTATDCGEVAVLILELIELFTCSRSEIIPLVLSGFNVAKHLRCCDIRWAVHGYLEICFRMIKQDPLCKRKACVAGEAWRAVGDAQGVFDLKSLIQYYFSALRGPYSPEDPFLLQSNGSVLTYSHATKVARAMWARVPGVTEAVANGYSLGGLRVLSRNLIAGIAGDETARVQGMWETCDIVYDRPTLERVLTVPARMAAFANSAAMPAGGVLERLSSEGMERLPVFSAPPAPFVLPSLYRIMSAPVTPARAPRVVQATPGAKPRNWTAPQFCYLQSFVARFRGQRIQWCEWSGSHSVKAAQHACARYCKDTDDTDRTNPNWSDDGSPEPAPASSSAADAGGSSSGADAGGSSSGAGPSQAGATAAAGGGDGGDGNDNPSDSPPPDAEGDELSEAEVLQEVADALNWALHLVPGLEVNEETLRALLQRLRRMVDFDGDSIYDYGLRAFNALQARLVTSCVEKEAEPYSKFLGCDSHGYRTTWIEHFAFIREKASQLAFGSEHSTDKAYGAPAGQSHNITLIYLYLLYHIAVTYESPATRAAGSTHRGNANGKRRRGG